MRARRSAVAVLSAALLCLVTVMSGSAFAHAKGEKGDPQPELKPFKIGSVSGPGSVAVMPNGDLVVAYQKDSGAETVVCTLKRAATSCTHSVDLHPLSGDSMGGVSEVYALSNTQIVVLQSTCCDANPNDVLLYTSTDGGSTFGAPVRVGSDDISIGAAALIGNQIVVIGADAHEGALVQSIATDATSPASGPAIVNDNQPIEMGVGSYQGGALIGNDVYGSTDTTKVEYASSGSDFNSAGSYTTVGSFSHEALVGLSGNALLTQQTNGKDHFELRFFNGSSFGAAHALPGYKDSTLGSWVTMAKAGGVTHVFIQTNYVGPIYDLMELSTTTGSHWTSRTDLGNAINNNTFNAGLDSNGSGLVLGTGGPKAYGYPVLATQSVSFSLSKSSIHHGKKVTGKGKGSAAAKGRKIELQIEKKGRWYDVASTKESASGAFSFKIKGASVGTFHYRAVANDHAGYVQFGYSSSRSLTVKS